MKKKISFIVLAITIISLFLVFRVNHGAKTIEEAINIPNSKPINIIYEEKTDKGSIVFYNHLGDGDYLSTAFVRKNIFGYKYVYGGVGDMKYQANKFGVSYVYFPNIENTPFPIYFGIIGNSDISQVKIIEKKRNIEGQAKIINANGTRIWLVYMNKFEGSDFEIIGLSADGKELTKIEDDISPNYAEQKPLKN